MVKIDRSLRVYSRDENAASVASNIASQENVSDNELERNVRNWREIIKTL
jgi:hypothetical protein